MPCGKGEQADRQEEVKLTAVFVEELLDEGVARNVFAVATVAAAARGRLGSVRLDAAPLAAGAAAGCACGVVKVRRVDLDELAVAGGLVAPLVGLAGVGGRVGVGRRRGRGL